MSKSKYQHTADSTADLSPGIIIPLVMELFHPASVVDIGCGIGHWMNAFQQHGAREVFGLDGFHLDRSLFVNKAENLRLLDLEQPFSLEKKYDLAISLEVAEHLKEESATGFVRSLCSLSDHILFSAAAPGQGGQNHKNEQWPSYWKEKFENNGFIFYDILRPVLWNNKAVKYWYRQNMFIASRNPLSVDLPERITDFIHPDMVTTKLNEALQGEFGVRIAFRTFLKSLSMALKRDKR
jgi:SAM-dependent methyltransferase